MAHAGTSQARFTTAASALGAGVLLLAALTAFVGSRLPGWLELLLDPLG